MKNECSIVKDLLPLYAEELASSDTAQFVSEHLKECEQCQKELDALRDGSDLAIEKD